MIRTEASRAKRKDHIVVRVRFGDATATMLFDTAENHKIIIIYVFTALTSLLHVSMDYAVVRLVSTFQPFAFGLRR